MRAMMFAVLALAAACVQPPGPVVAAPAAPAQSPVALQIRADMQRLERALHAHDVVVVVVGETADLGGGLTVRPLVVIEDSRCPSNVTCVWAGRLRLRASVSGEDVELTLGEAVSTQRGSVRLAVVSPGPWAEWPVAELGEKPAYRFGFTRT